MSDLIFPSVPGAIYSRGTPMYREIVQESDAGPEFRIRQWTRPRYRHSITWNFLRRDAAYKEAQTIASFLCQHAGRHESFLFKDPWDYAVTDHGFGVGDGSSTKFPLQRAMGGTYTDRLGTFDVYAKPRTNRLARSQEFGSAPWEAGPGTTSSAASNTGIGPDGTLTADTLSFPAEADSWTQAILEIPSVGAAFTFSVWVKGAAGQTMQLGVNSWGGTYEQSVANFTLSGAWQRLSLSHVYAYGDHDWMAVWIVRAAGQTATSLRVWGAQFESGGSATAYIPTAAAAVRSDPAYWTANQSTGAVVPPTAAGPFEPITEPGWAGVTLYKDGVALVPGTDFTFTSSGIVTFAVAPAAGSVMSWTGTYHKRVRFDDEEPEFDRVAGDIVSGGAIDLITVI